MKKQERLERAKLDDGSYVVISDFKRRLRLNKEFLDPDDYRIIEDGLHDVYNIYLKSASVVDKTRSVESLKQKWALGTNVNRKKLYVRTIDSTWRRILCGGGTVKAYKFVNDINLLSPLKIIDEKSIKMNFQKATNSWVCNKYNSSNSEFVSNIFNNRILKRIPKKYQSIFIPSDDDGNKLIPSSKYSIEYLKHSFNNSHIDSVIDLAKKYTKTKDIQEGIVTALVLHKSKLQWILDNCEIPSKNAQLEIRSAYDILMITLYMIDTSICSAIMKQYTEYRLYEENLSRGREVYLPSHGSFPTGDVITLMEPESPLLSCKYGKLKSSRANGCPANAKSLTQLHPDISKRFNHGQFIGEPGFTLVISDILCKGDSHKSTMKKIQSFIKITLDEVHLNKLFTSNEIKNISKVCADYYKYVDDVTNSIVKTSTQTAYWNEMSKKLKIDSDVFGERMFKLVSIEQITALVGKNNVKNFINQSKKLICPAALLCIIELSNNIHTSGGYGLLHNHQYVDCDGESQTKTLYGSTNPNDYYISPRMNRTSGRAGGGVQLSYAGDG